MLETLETFGDSIGDRTHSASNRPGAVGPDAGGPDAGGPVAVGPVIVWPDAVGPVAVWPAEEVDSWVPPSVPELDTPKIALSVGPLKVVITPPKVDEYAGEVVLAGQVQEQLQQTGSGEGGFNTGQPGYQFWKARGSPLAQRDQNMVELLVRFLRRPTQ